MIPILVIVAVALAFGLIPPLLWSPQWVIASAPLALVIAGAGAVYMQGGKK